MIAQLPRKSFEVFMIRQVAHSLKLAEAIQCRQQPRYRYQASTTGPIFCFLSTTPLPMIVNYTQEGWELITQRAHGIVAAQLGFHWRSKDRPERWMETLLAIAEHDDAEVELGGENLLTPTGGPLNFDMKNFELPHCQQLALLTQTKSRYIALLTSVHMDFLYRKDEDSIPEAKTFLKEQRQLQEQWRKELGMSKEEVLRIYDLMEWCDACSLLICRRQLQPEQRKLEISKGPDGKMYHLVQLDEERLTIDPWPFEAARFSINFESRTVKQLQFKNSKELREAFLAAPVQETKWLMEKQKVRPKNKKV
jgi:hypothetical protein